LGINVVPGSDGSHVNGKRTVSFVAAHSSAGKVLPINACVSHFNTAPFKISGVFHEIDGLHRKRFEVAVYINCC